MAIQLARVHLPIILISLLLVLLTTGQRALAEQRAIEHALGTSLVSSKPKRIAVLTNEGTEALLALGLKPIAAVKSWSGDPWYSHISEQMQGVETIGTESQVQLEALAWQRPDLIIANVQRHGQIANLLSAIAPTVFSKKLRDNWQNNFRLYAKAINKDVEGERILAEYHQQQQQMAKQLGENLQEKISVIRFLPASVRIYQKQSFSGLLLDEVGFSRPPNQDVDGFMIAHVGKEQIPSFDGDKLFVLVYDDTEQLSSKQLEQWRLSYFWQQLDVQKNQEIYLLSDIIWNSAGGILAARLALEDLRRIYQLEKD